MAQDLRQIPVWVRVGAKCRYYSETHKTLQPVVCTSIDAVKSRVVVHFEADHQVWKTIPFNLLGRNGPLRPPGSSDSGMGPEASGWTQVRTASGGSAPSAREKKDGTSTPPWYEQMGYVDSSRDDQKKQDEKDAQQERRRYAWVEANRQQAEEEAQARELERLQVEEDHEAVRIDAIQRLQRDREEEERRREEVQRMEMAEYDSSKVNRSWRQRERVQLQQLEEERQREEEEEQRLKQEQLQREISARPRLSFGMKLKPEPMQIVIPQRTDEMPADEDDLDGEVLANHVASMQDNSEPYNAETAFQPEHPMENQWGSASPAAPSEPSPSEERGPQAMPPMPSYPTASEHFGVRIRAIYETHNPTKLGDVPSLLEKYAGSETEMYARICDKYGVLPDPAPTFPRASEKSRSRRGDSQSRRHSSHKRQPELSLPGLASVPKASASSSNLGVGYARKASAPPPLVPVSTLRPSAPQASPELRSPPPQPEPPPRESGRGRRRRREASPVKAPSTISLMERFNNLIAKPDLQKAADDFSMSDEDHSPVAPPPFWAPDAKAVVAAARPPPPRGGGVWECSRSRSRSYRLRGRGDEEAPERPGTDGRPEPRWGVAEESSRSGRASGSNPADYDDGRRRDQNHNPRPMGGEHHGGSRSGDRCRVEVPPPPRPPPRRQAACDDARQSKDHHTDRESRSGGDSRQRDERYEATDRYASDTRYGENSRQRDNGYYNDKKSWDTSGSVGGYRNEGHQNDRGGGATRHDSQRGYTQHGNSNDRHQSNGSDWQARDQRGSRGGSHQSGRGW